MIEWETKVWMDVNQFLQYYRMINKEELDIVKNKLKGKGGLETWLREKYPDQEP